MYCKRTFKGWAAKVRTFKKNLLKPKRTFEGWAAKVRTFTKEAASPNVPLKDGLQRYVWA